jgi:uncharacterized protein (TIGR03000 family)
MAPAHHAHYGAAHHPGYNYSSYGYRGGLGYGGIGLFGLGYGLGYGGLGYGYGGLGYGYSGLGYGGYGYGYPGYSSGSYTNLIGVPAISGTYYPTPATSPYSAPFSTAPYQVIPSQPSVQPMVPPGAEPEPQPLPLPAPGDKNAAAGQPGTITVITNEGATVTFDGIDTKETGARHSFTTQPIPAGTEKKVLVKVDGPGGPSSITLSLKGGEKATVDMRK